MQRIIGFLIVVVSMIVFAVGGAAVPSANQWIAADCGYKTNAFLIGGIITMIAGATVACCAEMKKRAPALRK